MTKILLIEDHALVREGLLPLLCKIGSEVIVEEAADAAQALSCLERDAERDLVVLDLGLPGEHGLALLPVLRKRFPDLPVVVLSAYDDESIIRQAMSAGAAGFVPKALGSQALLGALQLVLAGGVYLPDLIAKPVVQPPRDPMTVSECQSMAKVLELTERQVEVLLLVAKGYSNRDIANQLGVAEGTVKVHVGVVLRKMGADSRTRLVALLHERGFNI